jgi:hypothetical protein
MEKFNSKDRTFMKLDSDKHLSLDKEMLSLEFILENLRLSPEGTLVRKMFVSRRNFF